jgi:predicted nucleic acid-binding Zn ribbon protein
MTNPVNNNDDPASLEATMSSLLRRLKMDSPREVGSVFAVWDDLVGPDVARHIQPVKLDEGTLYVEATDAAWATQFRFLESDVRRRLSDRTGTTIAHIQVRQKGR